MEIDNQVTEKQLVMIVDDHKEVLRFMEIGLKHHGFEVVKANSGKEALGQLQMREPHVILLDIVMPEMDGLEVLRRLRSFSSVPVIAFSATSENSDYARQLGANDFIKKPFYPEEMIKRINAVLKN